MAIGFSSKTSVSVFIETMNGDERDSSRGNQTQIHVKYVFSKPARSPSIPLRYWQSPSPVTSTHKDNVALLMELSLTQYSLLLMLVAVMTLFLDDLSASYPLLSSLLHYLTHFFVGISA